jgi:hypothetical protein
MKGALAFILFLCTSAFAVEIPVDLGSSGFRQPGTVSADFSALNGTAFTGQSLILDFLFANDEEVRIFSTTSFNVEFLLTTNGEPLSPITGTGFLTLNGHAVHGARDLGEIMLSGPPPFGFGSYLYPQFADSSGNPALDLPITYDFSGVRFNLSLPAQQGLLVTGGEFVLRHNDGERFAIGAQLPESGSSLLLLLISLGVAALAAPRWRRAPDK